MVARIRWNMPADGWRGLRLGIGACDCFVFSRVSNNSLYQGTTLVVPNDAPLIRALAPVISLPFARFALLRAGLGITNQIVTIVIVSIAGIKCLPMKLHRGRQMLQKVNNAVITRIEMGLVLNLQPMQLIAQGARAGI